MLDLHTHSTASDGDLTPKELVRRAKEVGLTGVALTDHDTMAGVMEAQLEGASLGMRVMPGVEISSEWQDTDVHILGYFVEQTGPMSEIMQRAREDRMRRAEGMVSKLRSLGVSITLDEVIQAAQNDIESLGRPHIARVLMSKGIVKDIPDAFTRYLERGKPAFVPRFKLLPTDALKAIIASRGVAVWAHPGHLGPALIGELVTAGLAGIEVFHPLHSLAMEKELATLASSYGLIITGGSDAHGSASVGVRAVEDSTWDEILDKKA